MATDRRGGTVGAGEAEADPLARFSASDVEELIDLSEGWPLRCALVLQNAASVQRSERAARSVRRGSVPVGNRQPPTSPEPCRPGCPGWAVFEVNREPWIEVQRCDECWCGDDAPSDAVFQRHPVCRRALWAAIQRSKVS